MYSDECHIVGGGNDIAASKLNTQRRFASSMLIDPAILWITGKKQKPCFFLVFLIFSKMETESDSIIANLES